jgi:putative FmdB family regulatory protein
MPLYEYECDACGHRFEKIQKFSDPPEQTCPKCGGTVHKLLASPAIQFKGSGWYITDYARKDGAKGAKEPAGDAKDTKAATEGAKETKTDSAAKADSSAAPPAAKEAKS